MPYRVVFDRTTKAAKVHREECRHSLVRHVSRSSAVWSAPFESEEEAIRAAVRVVIDHVQCGDCLSDHRCTEPITFR